MAKAIDTIREAILASPHFIWEKREIRGDLLRIPFVAPLVDLPILELQKTVENLRRDLTNRRIYIATYMSTGTNEGLWIRIPRED
jgi:hypothetical protein